MTPLVGLNHSGYDEMTCASSVSSVGEGWVK